MDPEQQTRTRSPRTLLRLLLLAGGAVVGWLLLSGGPAQADDTAAHDSGHAARASGPGAPVDPASTVAQTVSRTVSPTVSHVVARTPVRVSPGTAQAVTRAVTGTVRELPQSGTALLDSAAAAAPAPVRTATDQLVATTVEPALASIAGPLADVADAVDRTTAAADAVVDPVLQAAGAEGPARSSTSPATADVPRAGRHLRAAPVDSPTTSGVASATVARPVANLAPSGNDGSRLPAIPVSPDVPAAPAGSASAGAVGMLAFVLLPTLALLRRRIRAADEPLPAGPAFGPGSSPD